MVNKHILTLFNMNISNYIENQKYIFKLAEGEQIISIPNQVFQQKDFSFLFTIGGHLADGDEEYNKLTKLLKDNNEINYLLTENQSGIAIKKETAYSKLVSLDIDFQALNRIISPRIFTTKNLYISGLNRNWGIYICEFPTINIIGCTDSLLEGFSKAYKIENNGFESIEEFIKKEYDQKLELLESFKKNYLIT